MILFSLIMPKTYDATSVILQSAAPSALEISIPTDFAPMGLSALLGGASEEAYTLVAILKSRTMAESTIRKYGLLERYDFDNMDEAVEGFEDLTSVSVEEEGVISITALAETGYFHFESEEDECRHICLGMANYMVSKLDSLFTELKTKQAKFDRMFIERRYNETLDYLNSKEEEMKEFQETYGMISLPDQVTAAITAAAELESNIISKEIEIEMLGGLFGPNFPEVKQKELELREIRKRFEEMKTGSEDQETTTIFPLFGETPEIALKYFQLTREIEVQTYLYQFLTQQYEQAKISEAKDIPVIQIIDKAVLPIERAKPHRSLLVVIAGLIGIFFGIFLAFIQEYLDKLSISNPEKYRFIRDLPRELREDFWGTKVGKEDR
jgi:capsule polysaccharide export protein KpsE/RkpR